MMKFFSSLFVFAGLAALLNAIYVLTFKYNLSSAAQNIPLMTQYYAESMASGIIALGLMTFGMCFLTLRPMPRMPNPTRQ